MPNPVVFIPGYYGSQLSDRLTREVVWIDGYHLVRPDETVEAIRLDTGDPDRIVASALLDEVYVLPFLTPDIYKPTIDFLKTRLGLGDDRIYRFAVDWRKSIAVAADDLHLRILAFLHRQSGQHQQVDLVAHSHGGLVARCYLDRYGDEGLVDRLVTLGTPHKGMIETFRALVDGFPVLTFSRAGVRTLARSFPSAFELLPSDAADGLFTLDGQAADPFAEDAWTWDEPSSHLLADAEAVVHDLGSQLPVKCTFLYGTHQLTHTAARATADGRVSFEKSDDGDGTVPRVSALGQWLGGEIGRFAVPFGEHSSLLRHPAAQKVVADVLLGRDGLRPYFAVGWRHDPAFLPYTDNPISVEVRDGETGEPHANVSVELTVGGGKPIALQPTPAGDYYRRVRMPASGKHFEWKVTANGPDLPAPLVARGMLFAANT